MSTETPDLALSRWGLRFTSDATEADYFQWRIANASTSTRVATTTGLVAWAAVLLGAYIGVPEHFELAAKWILLLLVPLHLASLLTSYKWQRWIMPVGVIVNSAAGFVAIGISIGIAASLGVAVAGMTLASYFAFAVFRLTPAYAALAVIPYVLFTIYLVVQAFTAGQLERGEFTGYFVIPITAAITGWLVCVAIERAERDSYRKERIIQRQQQALDEERANLSRFLSPEVSRLVRERGIEGTLIQHTLPITVVCSDLRGFTAYTERFGAGLMATVLRDYYDTVIHVAKNYGGTVKDFAGDGALILVGAPISRPDHAAAGVALARDLAATGAQLVGRYSTPEAPLGIGIGVATGVCAVGAIGSQNRLEYTAVGAAVNLAARLCAAATHDQILLCPTTAEAVPAAGGRRQQPMQLKGFEGTIVVAVEASSTHFR